MVDKPDDISPVLQSHHTHPSTISPFSAHQVPCSYVQSDKTLLDRDVTKQFARSLGYTGRNINKVVNLYRTILVWRAFLSNAAHNFDCGALRQPPTEHAHNLCCGASKNYSHVSFRLFIALYYYILRVCLCGSQKLLLHLASAKYLQWLKTTLQKDTFRNDSKLLFSWICS